LDCFLPQNEIVSKLASEAEFSAAEDLAFLLLLVIKK